MFFTLWNISKKERDEIMVEVRIAVADADSSYYPEVLSSAIFPLAYSSFRIDTGGEFESTARSAISEVLYRRGHRPNQFIYN